MLWKLIMKSTVANLESEEKRPEYNSLLISGDEMKNDEPLKSSRGTNDLGVVHEYVSESMDFDEMESIMWRKHQLRRFFQDRGQWWTSNRKSTAYKWGLVVLTGVLIACLGASVQSLVMAMTEYKFGISNFYLKRGEWGLGFLSFFSLCTIYSALSGLLCWLEPGAVGSGIPEIKAYLNGVDLHNFVRVKVLFAKALGTCFSVSAGLPLGKEGPMIHAGSIVGAAVSQGKTITFGFDTSWTKFQDLRNDRSKRDFVTYGAAAGVAAAFKSPIGGILFTLEEGASFWSTSLTFRSFFCAMMTMLTISLIYNGFTFGNTYSVGIQFGDFNTATYRTYELILFTLIGAAGGVGGSLFNKINMEVTKFRSRHYTSHFIQFTELILITVIWTLLSFVVPLCWRVCTPIPTETAAWSAQEFNLLSKLVQFQCRDNEYNQVASLYFIDADSAMQQLFHFREVDGVSYDTFSSGALLLFFVPYFLMAAITAGTFCPAGLFVPTLLSGAALGRLVGHILNNAFPGFVAASGMYALIGAAAILGGMSRMTIAGAVILLEACGSTSFLLPLMLTFAAARYTGNAINEPMYDMQIHLKEMPFLEESIKSLGLLNYHPVTEIMAKPVITLPAVCKVSTVFELLKSTRHNGFPVVNAQSHLRGFVLRKVLCCLLKHKVFSLPLTSTKNVSGPVASSTKASVTSLGNSINPAGKEGSEVGPDDSVTGLVQLAPAASLFHDTMERYYPHYPSIDDITLSPVDMNSWVDLRPYMDTAPYSINETSSVQRCYRYFRTLGLRHLVVLDGEHRVTGIVTRQDLTDYRLEYHWFLEGDKMQQGISVEQLEPAFVPINDIGGRGGGGGSIVYGLHSTEGSTFEGRDTSTSTVERSSTTTTASAVAGETFSSTALSRAGSAIGGDGSTPLDLRALRFGSTGSGSITIPPPPPSIKSSKRGANKEPKSTSAFI